MLTTYTAVNKDFVALDSKMDRGGIFSWETDESWASITKKGARRGREAGIGDFEERDTGNSHFNEKRTEMAVDENLWRNWSSQSWKAPGAQSLKHSRGSRAA